MSTLITLYYFCRSLSTDNLFIAECCFCVFVCISQRSGFRPSTKVIYCDYYIAVSIFCRWKWSYYIYPPSLKQVHGWYHSNRIIFLWSSSHLTFITSLYIFFHISVHSIPYVASLYLFPNCIL